MNDTTIYTEATNRETRMKDFLFTELKKYLGTDDFLRQLTGTQLKEIVSGTKFVEFARDHIVLDDKVLSIADQWFGGNISGESLEKDIVSIPDVLDMEALAFALIGLFKPTDDEQTKTRNLKTVERLRRQFIKEFGAAGVKTISRTCRVSNLEAVTDLHTKSLHFDRRNAKGILKLPFRVHKVSDYAVPDSEKHLAEYESHFPDVKAVTDWIIAVRFAPQGKQETYLHIQAPSGWGKTSVFMQAWKDLEYGHETTLENVKTAVNGQTGTESAINFVQAAVVFFDEANKFTPELKNITRTIPITEKFKPRVDVPIYAKVMVSREDPNFLLGEVADPQVINRFNKISYVGTSTDYNTFLEEHGYDITDHIRALKWYIVTKMNEYVDLYRKDADACTKQAQSVMTKFRKQFGLHLTAKSSEAHPEIYGRRFLEYIGQQVNVPMYGRVLVRRAENEGKWEGRMYCSSHDFTKLWESFVEGHERGERFHAGNSLKDTKKFVLAGGEGKAISAKLNGHNAKWYIFIKGESDPQLTVVGGTDVEEKQSILDALT